MARKQLVSAWLALSVVLGTCASAHAQSMTIFGTVDTGVEFLTNANAQGKSLVRMPSYTGEFPSRIGFQGSEPLGDGYSAIFTLESGFTVGNGTLSQGGRFFGRQAFAGLSGPMGTLTLGRQYTMLLWPLIDSDLVGPSMYGLTSLDPYIANARSDNTVAYRHMIGNFAFGGTYSFGRDASPPGGTNAPGAGTCPGNSAGDAQACREWSLMLKYNSGGWGAGVAYDRQHGGTGAAANLFNGLPPVAFGSSGDRDARLLLDAFVKFGDLRVAALWISRHVTFASAATPGISSNQYVLEASYSISPVFLVDSLVQRVIDRQQSTNATMETLRGTYFLSKRTSVYAQLGWLQNGSNSAYSVSGGGPATPGKGMNQFGTMIGVRHDL